MRLTRSLPRQPSRGPRVRCGDLPHVRPPPPINPQPVRDTTPPSARITHVGYLTRASSGAGRWARRSCASTTSASSRRSASRLRSSPRTNWTRLVSPRTNWTRLVSPRTNWTRLSPPPTKRTRLLPPPAVPFIADPVVREQAMLLGPRAAEAVRAGWLPDSIDRSDDESAPAPGHLISNVDNTGKAESRSPRPRAPPRAPTFSESADAPRGDHWSLTRAPPLPAQPHARPSSSGAGSTASCLTSSPRGARTERRRWRERRSAGAPPPPPPRPRA